MIESRFSQDLKLLTREKLDEKYGPQDWDALYRGVGPIPSPIAVVYVPEEIALPADLPEEEETTAVPPYSGEAVGKFVVIRRLEQEHSGRLIMPSRISGTSDVGWVASVGEEVTYFKKGDIVLFDQYAGVGRECRLLDENGLPGDFLVVEQPDVLLRLKKAR